MVRRRDRGVALGEALRAEQRRGGHRRIVAARRAPAARVRQELRASTPGWLTSRSEIDYRGGTDEGGVVQDERGASGGRRGGSLALLGLVVVASSIGAPVTRAAPAPAPAPADDGLGFGQAQAVLVMIDPRSAELSFGVRFGPTVTDHRNLVARAVAQSTDFGLIGGALTGQGCTGRPAGARRRRICRRRLRADSRNPEDADERDRAGGADHASPCGPHPTPSAQATSRLSELEIPGALRMAGASNRTTSGVDDDGVPIALGPGRHRRAGPGRAASWCCAGCTGRPPSARARSPTARSRSAAPRSAASPSPRRTRRRWSPR